MDPGTGKSKVVLDGSAYLGMEKEIGGLIVIAPNGVHRNWITEEAPTHFSDALPYSGMYWRTDSASTQDYQRDFARFVKSDKFIIFAANIESLITDRLYAALREIIRTRCIKMVVDESADIKSPSAVRTKRALALAKMPNVRFRRILDGTPATENPFEIYSQFKFLDPSLFGMNFSEFKSEFGVWERKGRDRAAFKEISLVDSLRASLPSLQGEERLEAMKEIRVLETGLRGRTFPKLIEYRNMHKLRRTIAEHSFRVTKEEALPHLPPKQYTKLPFDLSPEARRMYNQLRSEYITAFPDGRTVTAAMRLTRDLRLQQIACGYVPVDPDPVRPEDVEPVRRIPGINTRLEMMRGVVDRYPGKMIIWCRFTEDINAILKILGPKAVRYDGKCSADELADNKDRFQRGDAEWFVGNSRVGGRGLTMTAAKYMLFYSSYFSLRLRLQAEDRAHRAGLLHNVLIIDPFALDTIDERIIESHRSKKELADMITGDPRKDWI